MSNDESLTNTHNPKLAHIWAKVAGAIVGFAALVWFLVRVLPKPSRASYPCQRTAFPVASAFVVWVVGTLAGWVLAARLRQRLLSARLALVLLGLIGSIGFVPWRALWAATTEAANQPIGVARGINPGRVVWARDPAATLWSGANDGTHWWDPTKTDQARVDAMLSNDLRTLTSTTTDAAAWDALFRSFNVRRGNGDIGYAQSARKGIAVKINQNPTNQGNNNYYANNGVSGDANAITGSPHLLLALVKSLVGAGVQETNITISDPTSLNHQWGGPRTIGDSIYTYVHAAYPGVHFVDGVGQQGRELAVWPTTNQIVYATGKGGTETLGLKIAQQFLDAGFIINMAIMKSHGDGPTVCFKNQYGSVSGQRHGPIYGNTSNYYANTIEPMGHQELGEKTVLFMIDALYGAASPNVAPTKWTKAPFNNAWPSSVFLSQDAVAIDSVAFDFMNAEWGLTQNTDYYLHDAASVPNAQGAKLSGTVYRPTSGSTEILGSLGVHEHWNNATARQYSRNLDPVNGKGIELVALTPTTGTGGTGAGGSPGTGGNTTTGGTNAVSGGNASTGGKAATGGASASSTSTGGKAATGGASASSTSTGGKAATGGASASSTSTGGNATTGGAVAALGGTSSSNIVAPMGGNTNTGGSRNSTAAIGGSTAVNGGSTSLAGASAIGSSTQVGSTAAASNDTGSCSCKVAKRRHGAPATVLMILGVGLLCVRRHHRRPR